MPATSEKLRTYGNPSLEQSRIYCDDLGDVSSGRKVERPAFVLLVHTGHMDIDDLKFSINVQSKLRTP